MKEPDAKTKRLQEMRRRELKRMGCIEAECREYCRVDYKSAPYFAKMILSIRAAFNRHVAQGGTWESWKMVVKKAYQKRGWLLPSRTGRGYEPDPWARVRGLEQSYQKQNPDWKSPEPKRPSKTKKNEWDEIEKALLTSVTPARKKI